MNHDHLAASTTTTTTPSMGNGESGQFLASQLRIATIVLTGLNIISATCMGSRIIWDARQLAMKQRLRTCRKGCEKGFVEEGGRAREKEGSRGGGRSGKEGGEDRWWRMVPAAEFFPLVLALGIIVQGIMFGIVESKALNGRHRVGSCQTDSEIVWAALWIVPYIIVVFTLETTIRALLQPRFKPRSPRTVLYCLALCLTLTTLTWIPSRKMAVSEDDDLCTGQLMSYVDQFARGALGLISALLPAVMVMIAVIFMHLKKNVKIEREERVSASRVTYHAAISAIQWILTIPNYATSSGGNYRKSLSFFAAVVLNSSGIAASILHIYLRAKSVEIGPRNRDGEPATCQRMFNSGNSSYDTANGKNTAQFRGKEIAMSSPSSTVRSHYTAECFSVLEPPRPSFGGSQSRASRTTVISLQRLGEEISSMIAGLQAAARTAGSTRSSLASPLSANFPLHHISASTVSKTSGTPRYSLFPQNLESYKPLPVPVSKFAATPPPSSPDNTQKARLQPPPPARRVPPARPNRGADMPLVNFDRKQPSPAEIQRQKSMASLASCRSNISTTESCAETVPFTMVITPTNPEFDKSLEAPRRTVINRKNLAPLPLEEAIPPLWAQTPGKKPVDPDAESFQEIMQWM